MADWHLSVNQASGTQRLSDVNGYIGRCPIEKPSPIDTFRMRTQEIYKIFGATSSKVYKNIGAYLLVGVVSATESYFRDMISSLILFCPNSREVASARTIHLSSILWHQGDNYIRDALEHVSLAGGNCIAKASKEFLAFEPNKVKALGMPLDEFDKVCEIRHAIAHSASVVAAKNALKLSICPCESSIELVIDYAKFQECSAVCNSLVSSYNLELFREMSRRWAVEWPKRMLWNSSTSSRMFNKLWSTFFSVIDYERKLIKFPLSRFACRMAIEKNYGIRK